MAAATRVDEMMKMDRIDQRSVRGTVGYRHCVPRRSDLDVSDGKTIRGPSRGGAAAQ